MPPYSVERAHTPTRYRVCDPDRAPLAEPRGGPRPSRPPQMDRERRAVAGAIAISCPSGCSSRSVGGIHGITGTQENAGSSYGSPSAPLPAVHLSPREREILRYVAAGHTTKALAAALNIAESTAEWHVSNILVKLGASSRAEAVAVGLREGLLEPEEQPLTGSSAPDLPN